MQSDKITHIGDFYILELAKPEEVSNPSTYCHYILVDNSSSMGSLTKKLTDSIGNKLLSMTNTIPGTIIFFDENVNTYKNIVSTSNITYPYQRMTNITLGIITCIYMIIEQAENNSNMRDVHYILTFISDGAHNVGPEIGDTELNKLRGIINSLDIKLSINVVGIATNDTRLGMKIKTVLETITLGTANIYYATSAEILDTAKNMIEDIEKYSGSGIVTEIEIENGKFLDGGTSKKIFNTGSSLLLIESDSDISTNISIKVNNEYIMPDNVEPSILLLQNLVEQMLPELRKLKIGYNNEKIKLTVSKLCLLLNTVENLFKSDTVTHTHNSAGSRLQALKEFRKEAGIFREQKNILESLLIKVDNDSSSQAKYLTGVDRKFAHKAIKLSNTFDATTSSVIQSVKNKLPELQKSIHVDENLSQNDAIASFISMNTPIEQLSEWLNFDENQFTDIYSLLVYFGFVCYPVKFHHNNAVQMDPYQTFCIDIEPYVMDTSSILLSNKTLQNIKTPSGKYFEDGLVLVEPTSSNSTKILMDTDIYRIVNSIMFNRDLYMWNNKIPIASHCHALLKAISICYTNKSEAYLSLAVKIAYSYVKLFGPNSQLFDHWWNKLGTLTQSEEDGCHHPVQLLPLLLKNNYQADNWFTATINMLNEVLARYFKIVFNDQDVYKILRSLLNIKNDDCPKPHDDFIVPEPSSTELRSKCISEIDITNLNFNALANYSVKNNLFQCVESLCLPYIQLLDFIQILSQEKNWISEYENNQQNFVDLIKNKVSNVSSITEYMQIDNRTVLTMFVQAMIHKKNRTNITSSPVTEHLTLVDMVIDSQMSVYYVALKEKYSNIQGNAQQIYLNAINTNSCDFLRLIPGHTFGLSKVEFWNIFAAANKDPEKLNIFMSKTKISDKKASDRILSRVRGGYRGYGN